MNTTSSEVLINALRLPERDRADLAAKLIDNLDSPADADSASAWDKEIANRLEEMDGGGVKAVPWAEARRQILADDDGTAAD